MNVHRTRCEYIYIYILISNYCEFVKTFPDRLTTRDATGGDPCDSVTTDLPDFFYNILITKLKE